jgi:hypothetical protein
VEAALEQARHTGYWVPEPVRDWGHQPRTRRRYRLGLCAEGQAHSWPGPRLWLTLRRIDPMCGVSTHKFSTSHIILCSFKHGAVKLKPSN